MIGFALSRTGACQNTEREKCVKLRAEYIRRYKEIRIAAILDFRLYHFLVQRKKRCAKLIYRIRDSKDDRQKQKGMVIFMGLNDTVSAERVHIGFFGLRNAGKSSVVNAVTGQDLALVSDVKGTTTDPVKKAMELLPLGPVVIVDTPGIDDEGEIGRTRVERAKGASVYRHCGACCRCR